MTVAELMEELESLNPEAEVRLATQPGWPLAFYLRGVVPDTELANEEEETDTLENYANPTDAKIVWLVEGGHPDDSPYAPRGAWR